jgi:hypothetical protein
VGVLENDHAKHAPRLAEVERQLAEVTNRQDTAEERLDLHDERLVRGDERMKALERGIEANTSVIGGNTAAIAAQNSALTTLTKAMEENTAITKELKPVMTWSANWTGFKNVAEWFLNNLIKGALAIAAAGVVYWLVKDGTLPKKVQREVQPAIPSAFVELGKRRHEIPLA